MWVQSRPAAWEQPSERRAPQAQESPETYAAERNLKVPSRTSVQNKIQCRYTNARRLVSVPVRRSPSVIEVAQVAVLQPSTALNSRISIACQRSDCAGVALVKGAGVAATCGGDRPSAIVGEIGYPQNTAYGKGFSGWLGFCSEQLKANPKHIKRNPQK